MHLRQVTHKVPWDYRKQEARIINEVKVFENGEVCPHDACVLHVTSAARVKRCPLILCR